MNKLLYLLALLVAFSGCDTSNITLPIDEDPFAIELEIPEVPDGTQNTESKEAEYEEDPNLEMDLIIKAKSSSYKEVQEADKRCSFESFLEENSSDILITQALNTGNKEVELQIMKWLTGSIPSNLSEITITADAEALEQMKKSKHYKIFLSKIDGSYQLTCGEEGITELSK